jgi:hypothetical protein
VNPGAPAYNGPGNSDIWLVPAASLNAGSTSVSMSPTIEVKRYLSDISFNWTTNGACIDVIPNGGPLSTADKGTAYRLCLPVTPANFNVNKFYKLKITDQFGNDECTGTVKVIPSGSGDAAPSLHFVIPDTGEYLSTERTIASDAIIPETPGLDVMIMPNPGTDFMQVNWSGSMNESVQITIAAISGTTLLFQEYGSASGKNTVLFDMSAYPPGVYAVIVQTKQGVQSLKWIKG